MTEPAARPQQVTVAGWMVVAASAMVVLSGWDTIATLHTLRVTEGIEKMLAEPGTAGLGLTVEGARRIIRVATMVSVACAVVTGILGPYALNRDRLARLGLSLAAVPLFVSGFATDFVFGSIVAASAAMLWLSPARQWFEGAPIEAAAQPPQTVVAPVPRPSAVVAIAERPGVVTAACVLTWAVAGAIGLGGFVLVSALASDAAAFVAQLRATMPGAIDSLTDAELTRRLVIAGAVVVVWSSVALALAGFVVARRGWARPALIGCSAATVAATAILVVQGFVLALLPLAAAAVVVSLLARPEARAWYAVAQRGHGWMKS